MYDWRIIVIEYNYYKDYFNDTTMLYRLRFIQGKAYWLVFKIHFISSWVVRQLYLDFVPKFTRFDLYIYIYIEREREREREKSKLII